MWCEYVKTILIGCAAVLVLGSTAVLVSRDSNSREVSQADGRALMEEMSRVIQERKVPAKHGFGADTYMGVFPGLMKKDFDNVLVMGGRLELRNGELIFVRDDAQPISTADGSLKEESFPKLLGNLRERLGETLQADEIVLLVLK